MAGPALRWVGLAALAGMVLAGAWTDLARADLLRPGTTERVSEPWSGLEPNGSSRAPAVSDDGRFVAFSSAASNLVPGDTNGWKDVFVRDRATDRIERVSLGPEGQQPDRDSKLPAISGDGRYVVFLTNAPNMVHHPYAQPNAVFVRDLVAETTARISIPGESLVSPPSVSRDGQWLAYASYSEGGGVRLVEQDTGLADTPGVPYGKDPSLSADGNVVVFWNQVSWDPIDLRVYVWDRSRGTTEWVSQGIAAAVVPTVSASGRFVAWQSIQYEAQVAPAGVDLWVLDRTSGQKHLLESAGAHYGRLAISDIGVLAFQAPLPIAPQSQPGFLPGPPLPGVYLWDPRHNDLEIAGLDTRGLPDASAADPALTPDGRFLAFTSAAGEEKTRFD